MLFVLVLENQIFNEDEYEDDESLICLWKFTKMTLDS